MKRQIRRGVFETNSSSTHSLTMCLESEYDKWENGELFLYDGYGFGYPEGNKPVEGKFYTRDEMLNFLEHYKYTYGEDVYSMDENRLNDLLSDAAWYSCDRYYWKCNDMETFQDMYTTPSGETVITFGYYGYDG